jgi:hypothetical protein
VAAGRSYALTHDLDCLIGLVAETGKDMTAYFDLGDLNPYAVELRYELDDDQNSPLDRHPLLDQYRVCRETACATAWGCWPYPSSRPEFSEIELQARQQGIGEESN